MERKYGWKPDVPDHRDLLFAAPAVPHQLPALVNLRPLITHVYDQGNLGSCTANAIGQAIMMCQKIQKKPVMVPSRLFIYYNERSMEGDIPQDNGAQIRDGIKSVAAQGACHEVTWPYDIDKFAQKPSDPAYIEAMANQVERYQRISQNSVALMKHCLFDGFPFVLGISVYESFESVAVANTGNAPLPAPSESMLGGHAIIGVGYNDGPDLHLPNGQIWPQNTLLCQNSWGPDWGLRNEYAGCFTLPYAYVANENLSDDWWTIRLVEC